MRLGPTVCIRVQFTTGWTKWYTLQLILCWDCHVFAASIGLTGFCNTAGFRVRFAFFRLVFKLETMAQLSEEAQMMLQSVTQAAKAAADAAQALRESNVQQLAKSTGFAEANKTVQCPKEFGSPVSAEDQNGWSDFAFAFKQWLCFADTAFTADLDFVEEHSDVAVTYKDTAEGKASEQRSKKLYAILSGIFRNRPLRLLRQVADNNGLEVWRQLHSLYTPKTKVRSMAILGTIMSFPAFSKERTLLEQIQVLERLGDECQKTTGANISEDILQTILVRSLPKAVQQHIQLGMPNTTLYQEVRERVVAYEKVSSTWSKDRILMECGAGSLGAVTSYAAGSDTGPSPMEVNLLQKGKGQKGKNAGKGKGQDSGKGKSSYGKGKGKGQDSGKGKGPNKGGGKAQSRGNAAGQTKQKLDANICAYCGKHGHWQRDCYKKKADQQAQQGQVRVVGEAVDNKQDTAHSTASFSTGSGSQAVRLVSVRASDHMLDTLRT